MNSLNWTKLAQVGLYPCDFPPFTSEFNELTISLLHLEGLSETISSAIQKGFRCTYSSVFISPPSSLELMSAACEGSIMSRAARALTKHSGRTNFWGKIQGNPSFIHERAISFVQRILSEYTWLNCFEHFKHQLILEYRLSSGHGARWTYPELKFVGFVEPFS